MFVSPTLQLEGTRIGALVNVCNVAFEKDFGASCA